MLKLLLSSSHYDNSHSTTVSLFLAAVSCALDQLPVVTYSIRVSHSFTVFLPGSRVKCSFYWLKA